MIRGIQGKISPQMRCFFYTSRTGQKRSPTFSLPSEFQSSSINTFL